MEQTYHFSAPGRVELSGNHTDHQHGCVLACAVDLEASAEVVPAGDSRIRVESEGFGTADIALDDLQPRIEEQNTTAALVRGVAAGFRQRGLAIGGFTASVRSTVLPGSGLSSSAAFEILLGRILNALYCEGALDAKDLAVIGQRAENDYFGKPCGLMDQMASSVGGLVFMDFGAPEGTLVERVDYDFARSGHALCIVDSGADHAALTDEYAAIPREMSRVCACFGKSVLREVDEAEFYARIDEVRRAAGDRAVLRAMHIFEENKRVLRQVRSLRAGDFAAFLRDVTASGDSSWLYLQNVTPRNSAEHQDMAFTIALCRHLLRGEGAVRVHGGGFAGTVLALVPENRLDAFGDGVERVLGSGSCRVLHVR